MNSKKLFSVILSGLFALTLVSCDFGSDEESAKQAGAEELALLGQAIVAIGSAQGDAIGSTKSLKGSTTIYYPGTGCVVTGTYETPDSGTYPIIIDLKFIFSGYTTGDVQLVSGTVYLYSKQTDATSSTTSYDGDFKFIISGVSYDITWDINYVMTNVNYTYSGTFTINGVKYTF